jgi:predicted nucleotidyltransferase
MFLGFKFYKELLKKFVFLLKKEYRERLVSIVLYGSVARGKAKRESDIDLLIILEDAPSNYHRRLDSVLKVKEWLEAEKVYQRLTKKLNKEPCLNFLILSREEAAQNRYIYLDMVEDAKILYDKEIFFANRLKMMRKRLKELNSRRVWLSDEIWYWEIKPDLKIGEAFKL